MSSRKTSVFFIAAAGMLLGGCNRDHIKSYTIPKEKTPSPFMGQMPPAASGGMPEMPPGHPAVGDSGQMGMPGGDTGGGSAAAAENSLIWTVPSNWQPKALGTMRRGSYSVTADNQVGDISVFVFPGAAGGLVDNINRWRGQIGMTPLDPSKAEAETVAMKTTSGLPLTFVDLNNGSGDGILGAILVQGDESWFFKLKGPSALLAKEKSAFVDFLKSVKSK